MSAQRKSSFLWLLTGVMVLIFAAAAGSALSGTSTQIGFVVGVAVLEFARRSVTSRIQILMMVTDHNAPLKEL
jgi:hypothetical protein